jgi:hypothetical protein
MTPFHNMALFSPVTPTDAAERHSDAFDEAMATLIDQGAIRRS